MVRMAWSLNYLEQLCGQVNFNEESAAESKYYLLRFLETAPVDFLEALINSPFGRVYNLMLDKSITNISDSKLLALRDELSSKLRVVGVESPEGQQVLLCLMPLYAPRSMKVEDAASKLPQWLYKIYSKRTDEVITSPQDQNSPRSSLDEEKIDFDNRIFLNRILGLSNLYYIDPEDKEILNELKQVRSQCVKLMIETSSQALASHFQADFGDRFWAMAQSGIQNEDLSSEEVIQRDTIQNWLTTMPNSLNQEGGIQRFAAALLFNKPGSIKIANPEQNLPTWFIEGYKRYESAAAR